MELLVVIAIIAILASILLPVMSQALKRADITRAKSEMSSIASAILSYFNEYGKMPTPDTNGYHDKLFVGSWGTAPFVSPNSLTRQNRTIFNILRAIDTTNNPRRIAFLDVPEGSMQGQSGLQGHTETYTLADGYYLDPWGNPYFIAMDTDFDQQIGGFNATALILYPALAAYLRGTYPGVRVGVMSFGPSPGETESFLTSW